MGEKHAFMNYVIETGRSEMPLSEKMAFAVIDEHSMHYFSSNKTRHTPKDRRVKCTQCTGGEHLSLSSHAK